MNKFTISRLSLFIFALSFYSFGFGASSKFEDCKIAAKDYQSMLPMKVDEATTWVGTSCTDGDPLPTMNYKYYLVFDFSGYPENKKPEIENMMKRVLKIQVTRKACGNKMILASMKDYFNTRFQYYYEGSSKLFYEFSLNHKECASINAETAK